MNTQIPKFTPPRDLIPSLAERRNLAGRWRRLFAATVDGIIVAPLSIGSHILMYGAAPWELEPTLERTIVQWLGTFGIYMAVNGFYLAAEGQTLGKRLLRIRIVRVDGSRATLYRIALARVLPQHLVLLLPVVGDWLLMSNYVWIFSTERRCLHDYLANTMVVNARTSDRTIAVEPVP